MSIPGPAVLVAATPPPFDVPPQWAFLAAGALILTGFFACLRSSLLHSVPKRVLEKCSDRSRASLAPLLERAESLAISAGILETAFQVVFVVFVHATLPGVHPIGAEVIGMTLAVSVPLLVLFDEVLPAVFRGERADILLRAVLPTFDLLQRPLAMVIVGLEGIQRALMRILRIKERPKAARQIVEDLRDVVEDSEREGDLGEDEREIIENALEFSDVDVAEIMTPRTELTAVEADAGLHAVVEAIAERGHTRIPIFEKNLDTIIGVAYAQEILQLAAKRELENGELRPLLRPVPFVPETKLVSQLLAEFRRERQKIAVVLDEYGGTAGIVTMGDIVSELVGDLPTERTEGPDPTEAIQRLAPDRVLVQASTRVSEVNEELELELPEEEDYETLAGFVLSELGHIPKPEETLRWGGLEFTIREANDRRVLTVEILLPTPLGVGEA